jgi:hypothetical protein
VVAANGQPLQKAETIDTFCSCVGCNAQNVSVARKGTRTPRHCRDAFLPERAALSEAPAPLVNAFVAACAA